MTQSSNLPAPYKGVDQQIPTAALESPFCENLLNFNTDQLGISLRYGDSKYAVITFAVNTKGPQRIFAYGSSKLFNVVFNVTTNKMDIYDVDAGTVSFSSAASGNDGFYSLYFNKYLFFFGDTTYRPGFYYDGAAFGNCGYTGTNINPVGGDVYKARAYLIQGQRAQYWYTEINAISGPCTLIDLNALTQVSTTLAIIAPITIVHLTLTKSYQAFVFFSGEVFFYGGSYPDSADWELVGTAKIAQPINYNSSIPYYGDTLVLCDIGVVSLRDLFLQGSQAAVTLSVSKPIQSAWSDLIQAIRTDTAVPTGQVAGIHGIWDSKTDRIIISFPSYLNTSGTSSAGSFYFVFDAKLQSWFFHRSFGGIVLDIVFYNNKVVTMGYSSTAIMVWKKEGSTGFMDRNADDSADVAYDYEMLSAPIPFPKTAVYEATQIEPILESDLYAQTNWNFIVDFGRQTSGSQQTDASTTAVAKPAVNVGMQNITFVQVKMAGTTVTSKTVGLDLYSYNVWYNAGEIASR